MLEETAAIVKNVCATRTEWIMVNIANESWNGRPNYQRVPKYFPHQPVNATRYTFNVIRVRGALNEENPIVALCRHCCSFYRETGS